MIFLGCLFDRSREEEYFKKSKCGISNAVNGYQWNLIDGFNANLKEPVTIINALPVGVWKVQYNDLFLETRAWSYDGADAYEIGCLNLPFIKQHQRYKKCLKILKSIDDNDIVIYSTYLPFLKAVNKLDKTRRVTLVVTDLPEFYDLGKVGFLRKLLRKINNKKIYRCMKRVDKFVILTEQMKDVLYVGERPYVVVEGICNADMFSNISCEKSSEEEKIILYTGTLHEKFGIGVLLQAFSMIKAPNYRLWICGGGDMQERVAEAAKSDRRITFFGYVPKKTINELQQKATILVNPRQNNDEFTKYSFPSKTMEYMLSGKPVVMYKLDGIPDEYDRYLTYVTEDDAASFADAMMKTCELSSKERDEIGNMAKDYVAEKKNSVAQTEKILNLMGIKNRR